jgi:hypothetical protein
MPDCLSRDLVHTLAIAAAGFAAIAGLTRFFATRRRAFMPADERPHSARALLRDPNFERGMRLMSWLQFAVAAMIATGAVAACLW